MRKFVFLMYDPRRFLATALILFFVLPLAIIGIIAASAAAMYNGDQNTYNGRPKPYTGGAGVAKVIYPQDGSTVTITKTGAVIKQSPGGTPYRQGWINPNNVNNYSSLNDMRGQIKSGSSNPYTVHNNQTMNNNNKCHCRNQQQNYQNQNMSKNYSNMNNSNQSYQTRPAVSYASASPNNYRSNSSQQYTVPQNDTRTISANYRQTTNSGYSAPSNNYTKSLPDTGPGNLMAIGGLTSVFATIGHFIYQRRRLA